MSRRQQWFYEVRAVAAGDADVLLDALGMEGWELVSVVPLKNDEWFTLVQIYLKRPVADT